MKWKGTTFEERFWSRVDKNGPVVSKELGPCWNWVGRIDEVSGYGIAPRNRWKIQGAHRLSFKIYDSTKCIDGLFICHRCDRRQCVRSSHLFLGSHADNMRDMVEKGRAAAAEKNGKACIQKVILEEKSIILLVCGQTVNCRR